MSQLHGLHDQSSVILVVIVFAMMVVGCLASYSNGGGFVHINRETQHFVDELNRTRIFHGVNAVYKVYPFYPDLYNYNSNTSLTDVDFVNLKNWGFNVIRLMLSWQGAQPNNRNEFDYNYFSKLKEIIRKSQQYDIMIILDVHQDVMSDLFCGEGFPRWAVQYNSLQPFPFPFESIHLRINQSTGAPIVQDCLKEPFFLYYLTQGASNAFQNFYDNVNGLRDAFANFWKVAANYFKDEENVLGLEILNEPWAGDIYKDLSLLLDQRGKADHQNLIPLYQQIYSAIRSVNSNHLVFFGSKIQTEPSVTDILSSGFEESPLGTKDLEKQVYSYHIYCGVVNSTGDPKNRYVCRIGDDINVVSKESDVKRLKTGAFLTEFGALSNFTQSEYELDWMTGLADQYLRSWSYWQFKYYNDMTTAASPPTIESFYGIDGQLQSKKVKALSRTYAQIVCGDPTYMNFDPSSSEFKFTFKVNENCRTEATLIYLNREFYYPKGFSIKLYPSNSMNILKQTHPNYLQFQLRNENVYNGQEITIQISSQ